ncbi:MAG: nickel pincer cofactor biosynthesis protein LarB [Promethearchaeota archaeon]
MKNLRKILQDLQDHKIDIDKASTLLKTDYLDKIDNMAHLDLFRELRTGIPEVIFAESKSIFQIIQISRVMLEKNNYALITRLNKDKLDALEQEFGHDANIIYKPNYDGRIAFIKNKSYEITKQNGLVGILTAGTSDIPVAEEAKMVLDAMGIHTTTKYDLGISGMHRIFPPLKNMIEMGTDVIIVIAGMEGTLPGIVSALVDIPVIGVPTSTGYGLGEKGKGALTTMLQSCSPGLAVVNIDNGFGAATMAALIVKRIEHDGGIVV